jgi:hypothetical protein
LGQRDLKKYLKELKKGQLEDQILDLYTRFKNVKEYYDFSFNPNENKLAAECKTKISKEYFPLNGRKPKARRSVAHKYIRHFKQLGVAEDMIADIMLFNIEIAQTFSKDRVIKQVSFYKSMEKSFLEAVDYISENGLLNEFKERIKKIVEESISQRWDNSFVLEEKLASLNLFTIE